MAADPVNPGTASPVKVHPTYAAWSAIWMKLLHCYDGTGGFLDGTYLEPHPREWDDYTAATPKTPSRKLTARRKLARYENVARAILDQKQAALFRESVTRTVGDGSDATKNHPLHLWWANVDGKGTGIDDYMSRAWIPAGVMGSVVHAMDRPQQDAPLTGADAAAPYLRTYTPLDLADWLTDDMGCLTAAKLLEAVPRTSFDAPPATLICRERIFTDTGWELYQQGNRVDGGEHHMGRVPVVIQYAKRMALAAIIGRSVLDNPQLYIDLFNLVSELRELLRNQTFSILNVPLGTGDAAVDIQKAMEMANAAGGPGTQGVMFTPLASDYISADATNVKAYQDEINRLLRVIYRLCAVPFEADSKDAEAEGSLKLKREDMNQILASYADECEKAEYAIVELWFRAIYGADQWKRELDAAKVVVRYPDTFEATPFTEVLEQAQAALTLEMPPAFMAELKRRLVGQFLPDASQAVLEEIDKALKEMAKQPILQQGVEATLKKMAARLTKSATDPGNQVAA